MTGHTPDVKRLPCNESFLSSAQVCSVLLSPSSTNKRPEGIVLKAEGAEEVVVETEISRQLTATDNVRLR